MEGFAFAETLDSIHTGLTVVGVSLRSVSVLQAIRPSSFVFRRGRVGLSNAITPLETLRPFPSIYPSTSRFHTQSMSFSILPLPFKATPTEKITGRSEEIAAQIYLEVGEGGAS